MLCIWLTQYQLRACVGVCVCVCERENLGANQCCCLGSDESEREDKQSVIKDMVFGRSGPSITKIQS